MAAYDIQKHFSGLRVQRRRNDPFATGFEDDSDEDRRKSRPKTKAQPVVKPSPTAPPKTSAVNPFASIDALQDSDDDFLDVPTKNRSDRRPSPAPSKLVGQIAARRDLNGSARRGSLPGALPSTDPKKAAVLAAGTLAYLDDSEDEEVLPVHTSRRDRRPSPAPRKQSDLEDPLGRSQTPRGERSTTKDQTSLKPGVPAPPKHTVASPFAGTKYLQDSDSDSDEEAVTSRSNSVENTGAPENGKPDAPAHPKQHLDVQRVDKPKQNGSGVSWRAFSASRAEQRYAEVEALSNSLRQRGRAISFCPHATTDDGARVPLSPSTERSTFGPRGRVRGKSPPRRAEDTRPTEDEVADRQSFGGSVHVYDPKEYKTNPFTDEVAATEIQPKSKPLPMGSLTSASIMSPNNEVAVETPVSLRDGASLTDSIESIAAKLNISPQTIPEGVPVEHSLYSPIMSPSTEYERDPLSRNSSTRSMRMARTGRMTGTSRRSSRRSNSGNNRTSVSPAFAFLSGLTKGEDPPPEPQADDEGQSIGLDNEYVIGRLINRGGFAVIKQIHSLQGNGEIVRAVKIVRKNDPHKSESENEKAQQLIDHEVAFWRHLKHRHILSLEVAYDTNFATFCVMDNNTGGTLFDHLRKVRQEAPQNEDRRGLRPNLARTYSYQLACALRYLHEDMRACHRDVKLENCLVDMTSPNAEAEGGNLRLCDFGLSDFLRDEGMEESTPEYYSEHLSLSTELPVPVTSSIIGTLEYASPKGLTVDHKLFETAGDVWAFGVVVYTLCTGDYPFRHTLRSKVVELILQAEWNIDALRQAGGEHVIELVKGCLEKDIDLRFTIGDILRSPWFEGCREAAEEDASNGWA